MNKSSALLLAALVGALAPVTARADKIDARLHQVSQKVSQKIIDQKYANVGVLRFQVEAPGIKPGYSTPLSGNLATRVETALILNAERDGKPAYGVTRDTGATAQKQKVGAWPSSLSERKKLFAADYPLAWGKDRVKADAFVTGHVKVSKDMKNTTVSLVMFDKATPGKMMPLTEFTVPTDRDVLRDLGVSYALPRSVRTRAIKLKKRSDEVDSDAIEIVGQQQQDKEDPPTDGDKPKDDKPKDTTPKDPIKQDTGAGPSDIGGVKVRLLADGEEAIIRESATQGDAIRWQVESPAKGKKISFELTNNTDKKLGVVLRLNGLNVINQQKVEPEFCGKIILLPGKKAVVRGFIEAPETPEPSERGKGKPTKRDGGDIDDEKPPVPDSPPTGGGKLVIRPFTILVGDEAAAMRVELGEKAGLIDIDVFEEGSTQPQGQVNQRGLPPSKALKARETYKGLKTALLQSSGLKTKPDMTGGVKSRELIVPAPDTERAEIKGSVTSFPNASLVSRVTIKVVPAEMTP